MGDDLHERLKDLLLRAAEAGSDIDRRRILDEVQSADPGLAEELKSYFPFLDGADNPVAAPDERPLPAQIGRYRVERLLARGGMGEVYLAIEPPPLARSVAVKLIRRGLHTRSMIRRFEFERDALKSLDHPNVARIIDAGATEDGLPFVAMEFVDGPTLCA